MPFLVLKKLLQKKKPHRENMKDLNELTVSPLCLHFTPTVEQRWTESIMGKDKASKKMLWGCHSEQEAESIQGKR